MTESALVERLTLSGMRGAIARTMTASLQCMAQFTLHRAVSAARLIEYRSSCSEGSRPSVNDLILAIVAQTLTDHPCVNATLEDETIFRWRDVHLGVAVAIDDGLVVPVIRDADRLSLAQIREESARLANLARTLGLAMADMAGGTFTVSNLGSLGVDAFTPIINPPQVAILGVGRIDAKGSVTLSLTIDHRAVDGAPGARFLDDVADRIESMQIGGE
jgi:pyruvate dehydrogenase E2 component (dihydrolipoamide acetyltransferase)